MPASYVEGLYLVADRPLLSVLTDFPHFGWFTNTHLSSVPYPNSSSHVTVNLRASKAFFYESRASLKQYFYLSIRSFLIIVTETAFCQIVFQFLTYALA